MFNLLDYPDKKSPAVKDFHVIQNGQDGLGCFHEDKMGNV